MPPGAPYHGFIRPYSIRVDEFTTPSDNPVFVQPALYLLTHTHSDHLTGLAAKSFASRVWCSHDAKEMLLRLEPYKERKLKDSDIREDKKLAKAYQHLKVSPQVVDGRQDYHGSRDLLHAVSLNTLIPYDLSGLATVKITLLDANHCPGAVIVVTHRRDERPRRLSRASSSPSKYLVEGPEGNILHTGDFRAEPRFRNAIAKNPHLRSYLSLPEHADNLSSAGGGGRVTRIDATLDVIYLDTACVWSDIHQPSKEEATNGLISLMKLYGATTTFFINSWTWGYEDILIAIAEAFDTRIHADRYKREIYGTLGLKSSSSPTRDRDIKHIFTGDPASTRFHACERFNRCEYAPDYRVFENEDGQEGHGAEMTNTKTTLGWGMAKQRSSKVVYINPVDMSAEKWTAYQEEIKASLERGDCVSSLLVPLGRHSALPELQSFVRMFRPARIVPNTLDPALEGLDWDVINAIFASSLDPSSPAAHLTEEDIEDLLNRLDRLSKREMRDAMVQGKGRQDAAISNLEGGSSATQAAKRWAENGNQVGEGEEHQMGGRKGKGKGKARRGMGSRMKRVLLRVLDLPMLEDWDEYDEGEMDETQEISEESQESVLRAASQVWKSASADPARAEGTTSNRQIPPSKLASSSSKPLRSSTILSSSTERHVPIVNIPVRVFPWSPAVKHPSRSSTKRLKYDSSRTRLYEEEVRSDEETQRDGSGSAMDWVLSGCKNKVESGSSDVEEGENGMDLDEVGRDSGAQSMIMIGKQVGMGEPEAEASMGGGTPKTSKSMRMPLTPEPEPEHRRPRKKVDHLPKTALQKDHDHHLLTKRARSPPLTPPNVKKTLHPYLPPDPSGSCLPQHNQFATTTHTSRRRRSGPSFVPTAPGLPIAAIPPLPDRHMLDPTSDCAMSPLSTIINHRPSCQHHSQLQSIPHFDPALASQDDSEATHMEHRQKRRRIEEWMGEESIESTSGRGLEENTRSISPHSAFDDMKGSPRRHRMLQKERSPAKPKVKPAPLPSTPLPSTPPPSLLSNVPFAPDAASSQKCSMPTGSSRTFRPISETASTTRGSSGRRVRTEADERDVSIIKLLRMKSGRARPSSSSRELPLPISQARTEWPSD